MLLATAGEPVPTAPDRFVAPAFDGRGFGGGFDTFSSPVVARSPWYEARVAPELRPVREDFVQTWRQATVNEMAPRGGSAMFREPSNRLDVRWRLVEAGSDVPPLAEKDEEKIVNVALLGAGLGFRTAIQDTLDRSEEIGTLRRIVGVAAAPSIEIRPGSKGNHSVGVGGSSPSRAETLAAADDEVELRKDHPSVRIGSGFHLVGSDADESQAVVAFGTFCQVQHVGVDLLRLEANFRPPGDDLAMFSLKPPTELGTWMAVARQDLTSKVSIHGDLWGEGEDPVPQMARSGFNIKALPHVLVVTNVGHGFEAVEGLPGGEWRADIGLQGRFGWRLPQNDGHWNLGQREGAARSWAPDPTRNTPNQLAPLVPPPTERYAEP